MPLTDLVHVPRSSLPVQQHDAGQPRRSARGVSRHERGQVPLPSHQRRARHLIRHLRRPTQAARDRNGRRRREDDAGRLGRDRSRREI